MTDGPPAQEKQTSSKAHTTSNKLFSRENLKGYLGVIIGILVIVVSYHLLTIGGNRRPPSGGGPLPSDPGNIPDGRMPLGLDQFWPIWGQLFIPSPLAIIGGLLLVMMFSAVLYTIYKKGISPRFSIIVIAGIGLIVLTNILHGWDLMVTSIAGETEIFWDAVAITNPWEFIANYNSIQPELSVHALTQPPGAVLSIYVLNLLFLSPGLVAIGLAALSGLLSAFFIQGILKKFYAESIANYGVFLYLLLPAVQVYYLANIYALVATFFFGLIFCYLHDNVWMKRFGSMFFLFLGTFTSFLFVVAPLGLFIFEILEARNNQEQKNAKDRVWRILLNLSDLVVIGIMTGVIYGAFYVFLGFNYIDAFLYASNSENPNGFMLLSNPSQYVATRMQDVLDIAVFFGPVMVFLFLKGIHKMMKEKTENANISQAYSLVSSFLLSLLLLFLTGAPKKGETARICMFMLPLLLIPVLFLLQRESYSRIDKVALLAVVFIQAVLMQTFGTYVW